MKRLTLIILCVILAGCSMVSFRFESGNQANFYTKREF